jgi:hypothetical protein
MIKIQFGNERVALVIVSMADYSVAVAFPSVEQADKFHALFKGESGPFPGELPQPNKLRWSGPLVKRGVQGALIAAMCLAVGDEEDTEASALRYWLYSKIRVLDNCIGLEEMKDVSLRYPLDLISALKSRRVCKNLGDLNVRLELATTVEAKKLFSLCSPALMMFVPEDCFDYPHFCRRRRMLCLRRIPQGAKLPEDARSLRANNNKKAVESGRIRCDTGVDTKLVRAQPY